MVVENVVFELGRIALWLQALGVVLVFWLIFEVIALIVRRMQRKVLYSIRDDILRIEKKIDTLLVKKR